MSCTGPGSAVDDALNPAAGGKRHFWSRYGQILVSDVIYIQLTSTAGIGHHFVSFINSLLLSCFRLTSKTPIQRQNPGRDHTAM